MKKVIVILLLFPFATFAQMPQAEFESAVAILFGNDHQKAITTLENAQKKYPNTYTTYYMQAIMQYRDGDNNGAMMSQSNAIKANPKFAEAYDARAQLFEAKGMYDKAIADETRAIALDPSNVSFLATRIRFYYLNKQYKEALEDTKSRIKLDPTARFAYYDAADFAKKLDPNANADIYFTQAYSVKGIPKHLTDMMYGRFMLFQDNFEAGREKYESAVSVGEKDFSTEDFYFLAICCYKTKRYDKAIVYYNKGIDTSPQNLDCLNGLSGVYSTQQNYEMLKTIARRTLAINPDDPWANKYMAIGLANTGQEALANEYNEKALRLQAEQTK